MSTFQTMKNDLLFKLNMVGGGKSQLTVKSATRAQRRTTMGMRWYSQQTVRLRWLNSRVYQGNKSGVNRQWHYRSLQAGLACLCRPTCVSTVACLLAPLMGVPLRWTWRTSIEVTNNSEASSFSGSVKNTQIRWRPIGKYQTVSNHWERDIAGRLSGIR